MSNEKYNSTILLQQKALFQVLANNIKFNISDDGHKLFASNILESQINNISIITNNPSYNFYLDFKDIQVYLEGQLNPTPVYGLFQILKQRQEKEDVIAFYNNELKYKPFIKTFQGGNDVNKLCDVISSLARGSEDTTGKVKTYTMIFVNPLRNVN